MPFIKTAFLSDQKNNNVDINHITAVRVRVTGSGNLKSTLLTYGENFSNTLAPIAMQTNDPNPRTVLADLTSFTAKLELETTEIDEVFNISQIIVWVRPVATQYPM